MYRLRNIALESVTDGQTDGRTDRHTTDKVIPMLRRRHKKGRNMILFTSCEGPSLDRVWQFPTDSQQTIIIWRETGVSRGTGMCLNIIFNLYISARVFIVEFKTVTAASGTIALWVLSAVFLLHTKCSNIFMARVRIKGRPIYFYTL